MKLGPIALLAYCTAPMVVAQSDASWWSLQPLAETAVPFDSRSSNPIDGFVRDRLTQRGLELSRPASPRTLVRRLYVDLVGVPAPFAVVEAFAREPTDAAWQNLVDDLLDSPHYGERWARHWLDVARFGESDGFEYNTPRRSAWHYRDWVIRALNDDLPYDQFVRMQVAGDLLEPSTIDGAAAAGFLVAGVHNAVLGKNPKMKAAGRQDELEEIVGTMSQAFLGMTVHCARCHDHKFDPITTREYYQLSAALDGVHHGVRKVRPADRRALDEQRTSIESQLVDHIVARGGTPSTTANILTSTASLDVNDAATTYRVSLEIAPTVWANPNQATAEGDGVSLRLIDAQQRIVATHRFAAGAWDNGAAAGSFQRQSFVYRGSGTGPVRIQLLPSPIHRGRFGGAVDNLEIRAGARTLFREGFDDLRSDRPGRQAHTERAVYHSATSDRWSHRGVHAIHLEERQGGGLAIQLFAGQGELPAPATDAERRLHDALTEIARNLRGVDVHTVCPKPPGTMRIHRRGSVEDLGEAVSPAGLNAVQGISADWGLGQDADDRSRRLALAAWLTSPDNPLFYRVIVNRVWHHHFGRGLVATPNDLGRSGGQPSHPELLDWLAVWFRSHGQSLKQLHRLIVTSSTYRQSSSVSAKHARAVAVDRGNRLLWRQTPRRIEAEVFRDALLSVSGALNPRMFGPGFVDVRIDRVPPAHYYVALDDADHDRRTIYRWSPRGQRSSLLDTFDCPDPSVTSPQRSVTTTPLQALSQWNHPFVLRTAQRLAERIRNESGESVEDQVDHAFGLVLARRPDLHERERAAALVTEHGLELLGRVLFNLNEFIWIR